MKTKALTMVLFASLTAASQPSASELSWPRMSQIFDSDGRGVVVDAAELSPTDVSQITRIADQSLDQTCRKLLLGKNPERTLQKLLITHEQLRVNGAISMVVQGGGDWEDSADDCFSDGHMNFNIWVLQPYPKHVTVLLQTLEVAHAVLQSSSHGYFDLVTTRTNGPGQMELTWWRFNGKRYKPDRCASLRYLGDGNLGELSPAELDRGASISERLCR